MTLFDDTCKNNDQLLSFHIDDFDIIVSKDIDTAYHLADVIGFNTSDLPVLNSSPSIIQFQSLYKEKNPR